MTTPVRKSQLTRVHTAKLTEYRERMLGAEVSHRLMDAMVSGFDDGWRSCITAMIELGVLEWAPEPPIQKGGETDATKAP